ncbi:unknown protein [Microcystis aeruginosa NIES-843]|uniref:Uncharacterized protein n=1 Tax=Microcystis aeruginosa (strain NIES-843 / IAM M-2473) TaxID=449447 RepID=B0JKI1_MICAN|nr:unknown protein [Microcystis aeruginosa NIES-843]
MGEEIKSPLRNPCLVVEPPHLRRLPPYNYVCFFIGGEYTDDRVNICHEFPVFST